MLDLSGLSFPSLHLSIIVSENRMETPKLFKRTVDPKNVYIPFTVNAILLVLFGLYWLFSQQPTLNPKNAYEDSKRYAAQAFGRAMKT